MSIIRTLVIAAIMSVQPAKTSISILSEQVETGGEMLDENCSPLDVYRLLTTNNILILITTETKRADQVMSSGVLRRSQRLSNNLSDTALPYLLNI